MRAPVFVVVLALVLCAPIACAAEQAPQAGTVSIQTAQTRYSRRVVSFYELRQARLVRQTWDTSCGAAALSTVLTYDLGIPATEYAIATLILRGGDPARVRQRGGFSLLDLKRFVESIGLIGEGYGSMSFEDLAGHNAPAIVPIRSHDLDHFVIFRGRLGDRVLLADPAFGNVTMPVEEFTQLWRSRIAFYVRSSNSDVHRLADMTVNARDLPVPDLAQVGRMLHGATTVSAMRQLPLVARSTKP
jgi:predicted double-glycine peptidase